MVAVYRESRHTIAVSEQGICLYLYVLIKQRWDICNQSMYCRVASI